MYVKEVSHQTLLIRKSEIKNFKQNIKKIIHVEPALVSLEGNALALKVLNLGFKYDQQLISFKTEVGNYAEVMSEEKKSSFLYLT